MKIIKPSVEYFGQVPVDFIEAIKFIEKAGRVCYKSEDKIADTSAEPFVKRLINAGHLAMVEHSNFVITGPPLDDNHIIELGKYLKYEEIYCRGYVGGNLTAWYQAAKTNSVFKPFAEVWGDLFEIETNRKNYWAKWEVCQQEDIPKELHRYSARFICDRGVSHELVRHRPCSFAQESTRYVNYGGKDMEFIEPAGFGEWPETSQAYFREYLREVEALYKRLLSQGLKPQQARAVLPNALKTEIVVTADLAEWRHIKSLRNIAPPAHPDMARVMNMMPWEEMGI